MLKIFCAPVTDLSGSATVFSLLERVFLAEFGGSFPDIKKTSAGKPYFPDRPEIHFSLSHTKTHVLCALSDNPVGVDIESPREVSERAVRFFCSPEEFLLFNPLDLWVLKESYIKFVGKTLALVKTIRFSRENNRIIPPDKFAFSKLYHIEGCYAAVTTSSDCFPESIDLVLGSSS